MYDGSYFNNISTHYKFDHPRHARLAIGGVHNYIKSATAYLEGVELSRCQIVEAHYFRGRFSVKDLNDRSRYDEFVEKTLKDDRTFDQILAASNVTTHYVRMDTNQDPPKEQGIDVWLAIEAFDIAVHNRCDVVALIAGDGDFVPLVRKINSIGKRALVMAWDLGQNVRYSKSLANEASYFLDMADLIDNPGDDAERAVLDTLFVEV